MKILELPAEERPRERLWKQGAEALKVSELLAILLRTGIKGKSAIKISEELLYQYGSLDKLCRADVKELSKIKGIGFSKSIQLKASFELGSRLSQSIALSVPLDTPHRISDYLGDKLRQLRHETLHVLALNTRYHLIAHEEISSGTVNETIAHPRDILRVPILHQAYAFVLVHNHPSGDPSPSTADYDFTLKIKEAAQMVQVSFLDHVILGIATPSNPKAYYSFREEGYI
jgi:DNA repair protein RadC